VRIGIVRSVVVWCSVVWCSVVWCVWCALMSYKRISIV
jgi:hypothetical protein